MNITWSPESFYLLHSTPIFFLRIQPPFQENKKCVFKENKSVKVEKQPPTNSISFLIFLIPKQGRLLSFLSFIFHFLFSIFFINGNPNTKKLTPLTTNPLIFHPSRHYQTYHMRDPRGEGNAEITTYSVSLIFTQIHA